MNTQRKRKEETVDQLQQLLTEAKIIVLAHYAGSSVSDLTQLRGQLAPFGGCFRVAKNRLAQRAIEGTRVELLKPLFSGPTAIIVSNDEAQVSQIPKTLVDFGKEHEQIRLIGGSMDGVLLDVEDIKKLAALPSMNDLRAQLIGFITMPITKLATLLNQPATGLARLLSARQHQT